MASSSTSTQLYAAATLAAIFLAVGYRLGVGSDKNVSKAPTEAAVTTAALKSDLPGAETGAEAEEEDTDVEDVADGDLTAVRAGWTEPCKLVLVVRTDLNMTSGKIAAQCSHATLACYKALSLKNPKLIRHWEFTGQAKIALKATSEDQLLELEAVAKSLNLCARSIHDAGRTQVAAGSRTVLGIGPGPVELINRVTGKLRLL